MFSVQLLLSRRRKRFTVQLKKERKQNNRIFLFKEKSFKRQRLHKAIKHPLSLQQTVYCTHIIHVYCVCVCVCVCVSLPTAHEAFTAHSSPSGEQRLRVGIFHFYHTSSLSLSLSHTHTHSSYRFNALPQTHTHTLRHTQLLELITCLSLSADLCSLALMHFNLSSVS